MTEEQLLELQTNRKYRREEPPKQPRRTGYRKQQPEFELQKLVTGYLNYRYPDVLFLSDVRASLKLTIPQAVRSKQIQHASFACPDMVIFEPRGAYHGMFLELKAKSPYLKDGKLSTDAHIQAQAAAMERLTAKGYHCGFYWDFDQIVRAIEEYLMEKTYD